MVSYCFIFVCVSKLWWTYILQKGGDKMNELYHYGIKGMKWGVRRRNNQVSKQSKLDAKNVKKANKYLKNNALWKTRYETSKNKRPLQYLLSPTTSIIAPSRYNKDRVDKIIAKNNKKLSEIKINDRDYELVNTYIKQLDLSDIKFNTITYRTYNAEQYVKK